MGSENNPSTKNTASGGGAGQDPRMAALVHTVVRQGDFIVLLVAALVVSVYITVSDFKLPNQKALAVPPPFDPNAIQLVQFVFQDRRSLDSGATTSKPEVEILGQIMDFGKIKENWPDYSLIVDGTKTIPNESNGSFSRMAQLKPGTNVIESSIRINGKDYDPQTTIINYQTE